MSTVTFIFIKSLNLRFSMVMHMTYFEMLHKLLIGVHFNMVAQLEMLGNSCNSSKSNLAVPVKCES